MIPETRMMLSDKDVRSLQAQLRTQSDFLRARQCADHAGKWPRGTCLQCEVERLRIAILNEITELAALEVEAAKMYNLPLHGWCQARQLMLRRAINN